jgi:RNA polymerase sigma factor (sigma-70 family)
MADEKRFPDDLRERWNMLSDGLIRSFAWKYGFDRCGIDPDDIVQETKIRLWKVLENGRDIDYIAAYVRKIVDSVIIEQLDRRTRERTAIDAERARIFSDRHQGSNPPGRFEPELADIVREALPGLGASRRAVLQLTIAGFSIMEIASLKGWTLKKTYHLYERGLKDIRRILAPKGALS